MGRRVVVRRLPGHESMAQPGTGTEPVWNRYGSSMDQVRHCDGFADPLYDPQKKVNDAFHANYTLF